MILFKSEILRCVDVGDIVISPFDVKHVGPNSVDVTLAPLLHVYTDRVLDPKKQPNMVAVEITESGYVLQPGELYIGCTNETATSKKHTPMYDGRSSMGRLGISSHICAGFGDVGWGFSEDGTCTFPTWTLELTCVKPVMLYPNMRIGQVFFLSGVGELSPENMYHGKYGSQRKPQGSLSFLDFSEN